MNQALNNAREKLAALPKWLKIAMWLQVMSAGTLGFIGFGGMMAVQTDQIAMIANVMHSLPKEGETYAQLMRVIEIGARDGRMWVLQLITGLTISVAIGFAIGIITPSKSR